MDLSLTYLGLALPHPLMAGASPLSHDLGFVRRLEDAGTAAIVMHSLFEEQITREQFGTMRDLELHSDSNPEARSYLPQPKEFALGPDEYVEQIRRIKAAVAVPVIASLNGTSPGGWTAYAELMEAAGADALEINLYEVATDITQTSEDVEQRMADTVRLVKSRVSRSKSGWRKRLNSTSPSVPMGCPRRLATCARVCFNCASATDISTYAMATPGSHRKPFRKHSITRHTVPRYGFTGCTPSSKAD